MNRSDDYGRRRRPDQQYGGYEEGYGNVPGDDRNWRRRDLSAGRYGNAGERNPYDAYEDRDDPRNRGAWRQGRTAQLSGGWRSRGAAVYYPGRSSYDESRDEEAGGLSLVAAAKEQARCRHDGERVANRERCENPGRQGS